MLDGSLQRTVSQARAALGHAGHALIKTLPKHGYRFAAPVTQQVNESEGAPAVRYVRSGELHIAYSVMDSGSTDMVFVLGWTFSMRSLFEQPEMAERVRALARLGRVIVFDKRGTGLSDRGQAAAFGRRNGCRICWRCSTLCTRSAQSS